MTWQSVPPLLALQEALLQDPSTQPVGKRMRATYFLRHVYEQQQQQQQQQKQTETSEEITQQTKQQNNNNIQQTVLDILSQALLDARHGSLLRHEIAYNLGQLRDARACLVLEQVLSTPSDCVMVRHEAAEALGAIGNAPQSRPVLQTVVQDDNTSNNTPIELKETCQLALNMMDWREKGGDLHDMPAVCACMLSPFLSHDPAPAHPLHANLSTLQIGEQLRDPTLPLFERYRAMFSLRNRGGAECVQQLGLALTTDDSSALLRHEVAYVLGQLAHVDSIPALETSLRRRHEHAMVRHESAEALGAIMEESSSSWDAVQAVLEEFSHDPDVVVRESCLVALDAADYWGHYAAAAAITTANKEQGVGNDAEEEEEEEEEEDDEKESDPTSDRILINHFNIKT